MSALQPRLEGQEVVVTVSGESQATSLDDMRIPFNQFLAENGWNAYKMRIEKGQVKETGKRPYTDKEKLDFLIQKNSQWQDLIQKLQLRLP